MDKIELKASQREETGKKVSNLRSSGKMPAVLYGHKVKNINLVINYVDFTDTYQRAGESTLVDLIIDDKKPVKVLIQEVQADTVSGQLVHADFHQVRMDEKITTEIGIKFEGEALAEKELDGILVKNFDKIKVECLPQYLIHEVTVDVSSLKTFEDEIKIKDLSVPKEINVLDSADEIVAHVLPPKSEEELQKELEGEVEEKVDEVEVEEKGKAEEGDGEGAKDEPGAKKEEGKAAGKSEGDKKNE
ncbi:MAG: 50S ribosomal protein L25 [Patescibacteria group bacterium]